MTTALFRKIDCLGLPVKDLDEAIAFYGEGLGHELIWRSETAAGFRLPDSNAELVVHTDKRPMETDLTVASVPDAIGKIVSSGGSLITGPFEIRIGLCAVMADPWNNILVILDNSKGLLEVDKDKNVIAKQ